MWTWDGGGGGGGRAQTGRPGMQNILHYKDTPPCL